MLGGTKDLEYWLLTNDEAVAKHREEKREILERYYGIPRAGDRD